MGHILASVLSIALGVLFAGCAAANWAVLVRYLRRRQQGSSVPRLGGFAGAVALVIAGANSLWWLPLIVDPGTAIWLASVLVYWASNRLSR